ncbi:hypothetical protein BC829DRAFT_394210 [Chytridium lagenaria]|nr:hypothetical protein BC829DRAFT_394210 [Chytridium lagenaria]
MPGILTQLEKTPRTSSSTPTSESSFPTFADEFQGQDASGKYEPYSPMVGRASYVPPPDFSESVKHELSFLEKVNNLERCRPTLPPIKHTGSPEPHIISESNHAGPVRATTEHHVNNHSHTSCNDLLCATPMVTRLEERPQLVSRTLPSTLFSSGKAGPTSFSSHHLYTGPTSFSPLQSNATQKTIINPVIQETQLKNAIAAAVQKKMGSQHVDAVPHHGNNVHGSMAIDSEPRHKLGKMREESNDGKMDRTNKGGIMKQTEGLALPEGWAESSTKDGRVYYIDHITRTTTWTDPRTVPVNGRYRVKDHQGNIQEMVIVAKVGSQMTAVPANQYQHGTAAATANPSEFFEDPRKKAEERIRKKLRDIKG